MVIMDLWGMFYHPVVVRARTFVLLLDLISAYCGGVPLFSLTDRYPESLSDLLQNHMSTCHTIRAHAQEV